MVKNLLWVFCNALCWIMLPIVGFFTDILLPSSSFVVKRKIRGFIFQLPLMTFGLQMDQITVDNPSNLQLGENIKLYQGSVFSTGRMGIIELGDNTHIGFNCVLAAGGGSIKIGKGVAISSNVTIYTSSNKPCVGRKITQSIYHGNVTIGSNVLIGMGVCILPGVSIGDNASVGAGSVVVKDVLEGDVVVGVPAALLSRGSARDQ